MFCQRVQPASSLVDSGVACFCVMKLEGREAALRSHIYFTYNMKCGIITSVWSSVLS